MTTNDTSGAQGRGTLSAAVGVSGEAVGGRYIVGGRGRLSNTAKALATTTGTAGVGRLKSWGDRARLSGRGQVSGLTYSDLTFFEVTGHYDAIADPRISGVTNSPIVQPINALITFTPRLDRGRLLYVSNYLVQQAYNAEQTINLIGNPTGGTWTAQFGPDITTALAWDIAPSGLESALEALPSIGAGNVNVLAGVAPLSYEVEFTGDLGLTELSPIVGDASLLSSARGLGFCEITVTRTALGGPQIIANSAIALPALTARIWNGVLSTIDYSDTPGFQLAANIPQLNVGGDLIYDVTFSKVTFNGATQSLAPFAFVAPTDSTPVCLSDPALERLPYQSPSTTTWVPATPSGPVQLSLVGGGNWRQRAGISA